MVRLIPWTLDIPGFSNIQKRFMRRGCSPPPPTQGEVVYSIVLCVFGGRWPRYFNVRAKSTVPQVFQCFRNSLWDCEHCKVQAHAQNHQGLAKILSRACQSSLNTRYTQCYIRRNWPVIYTETDKEKLICDSGSQLFLAQSHYWQIHIDLVDILNSL